MSGLERLGEMLSSVFCSSLTLRFGEGPYRIIPGSVKDLSGQPVGIDRWTGKPTVELDPWVGIKVNRGGQVQFKIETNRGERVHLGAFDFVGDRYNLEKRPPCGRLAVMNRKQRKDFLHPKRKEEVAFLPGVTGVWKP